MLNGESMQKKQKLPKKALLGLVSEQLPLYVLAAAATVMHVLISFATPALLAELFDHHLAAGPSRLPPWLDALMLRFTGGQKNLALTLLVFGIAIVLIHALKGAFNYIKGMSCARASEKTAEKLRGALYRHLQRLPFAYHVKAATGDLLQRCTSDVDTVRRFLNVQLMSVFSSILMVAVSLMLMLPISPRITLLSALPLPVMLLFSWKFFGVVINAYQKAEEAEGAMSTVLQETLTGIRVVRAFGQDRKSVV